ncbi:MAG: C_GCAxxG_C_C family protein [Clostridiales bacterium]|nr:C_GCAxxG_C_C family protein [Clostridiales bacterium]
MDEKMNEQTAGYLLFDQEYDCAQSVFQRYSEELGIDRDDALKIAACFGGGMQQGDACGCVTGALMAIGLKYGFHEPKDAVGKKISNAKGAEFIKKFREKFGAICCRDLIGVDVSTDEGKQKAFASGVIRDRCPGFVTGACEILDDMLQE